MTLNFPGIFPPTRQLGINFNWVDVQDAIGYVLYDTWGADLSTGDDYYLTPSTQATQLIGSPDTGTLRFTKSSTIDSDDLTKTIDIDFDSSEFNLPRTGKGTAVIRLSTKWTEETTIDPFGVTYYWIVKLIHYDGSTETTLDTVQTASRFVSADETLSWTMPLTISSRQLFKKGDILRITVEGWGQRSGGSGTYSMTLYHDPRDADLTGVTDGSSRTVLAMPFELDI